MLGLKPLKEIVVSQGIKPWKWEIYSFSRSSTAW